MRLLITCAVLFAAGAMAAPAADEPASAPEAANIAPNPGFESPATEGMQPDGWTPFTSRIMNIIVTKANPHGGEQSLKMSAQKAPKEFQGLLFNLPVAEGERYSFTAFVRNDNADPLGGTARGQLVIEWQTAAGKEVSRATSPEWGPSLTRLRWDTASVKKTEVPKGATAAKIGIHMHEGPRGGQGSFYVDDVVIIRE